MNITTLWWLLTGIAVAVELATGTFYLLMVAAGLAAGAIAAHIGLRLPGQIVVAALVGTAATLVWHWHRKRHPAAHTALSSNRDVNLDVGERVNVASWATDRTARVSYRGSQWTARLQPGAPAVAGEHVVHAVEGNWLVLSPLPAHHP